MNPPKRPIGAFNWFVKDYIAAKSPDVRLVSCDNTAVYLNRYHMSFQKFGPAAMVEAGQKWREMSDIEKQVYMQDACVVLQLHDCTIIQPYREKATSDAVRYQQEISDFRVLHGIGSVVK